MFDIGLSEAVDRSIARLSEACQGAPTAAAALEAWVCRLSPTGRPRDHFEGGRATMLLLPWWLEKRIRESPDISFQERLVESSINAYYFVRLIDNVMDENASEDRPLLPLLGILHSTFVRAYRTLFPIDDPFWALFERYWNETLEATLREKTLTTVSADDFTNVAARKTAAIKVPLAAVCCRYNRSDLLESWCGFYDGFARWQQMADDTFDWVRDLRDGNITFFLSEAIRQKRDGESVAGWVVRGGFSWALGWLESAMRDVQEQARNLDSPELVRFLEYRAIELHDHGLALNSDLNALVPLADAFEPVVDAPAGIG